MTELTASELTPPVTEEVDLKTVIRRIPGPQSLNLPRPGIPDFSDEATYTLLVNLARELDDPETHKFLDLIPSDFQTFRQSSAGKHFAGEIPRSQMGDEGNQLLLTLSKAVLVIPTSNPEARLRIARDAKTGKAIGYVNASDFGLIRDGLTNSDNPHHFQRFLEVLDNSEDPYWVALAKASSIPQPTSQQLNEVKIRLVDTSVIAPNQIYVHPSHRRKGVASALVKDIYQGAAVVGDTRQPSIVNLRRKALPDHTTILAPAIGIEGEPSLEAIALSVIPLDLYIERYKASKAAGSPHSSIFEAFADLSKVVTGVYRFNHPEDIDEKAREKDITYGLERGFMTPREARLLRVPDISNIQYPIVSIPKLAS